MIYNHARIRRLKCKISVFALLPIKILRHACDELYLFDFSFNLSTIFDHLLINLKGFLGHNANLILTVHLDFICSLGSCVLLSCLLKDKPT
jgi:hypothetical protein